MISSVYRFDKISDSTFLSSATHHAQLHRGLATCSAQHPQDSASYVFNLNAYESDKMSYLLFFGSVMCWALGIYGSDKISSDLIFMGSIKNFKIQENIVWDAITNDPELLHEQIAWTDC